MNRPSIAFSTVLEALGASETAPIEVSTHWEFYNVKYPTPAGPKRASYLSLAYDCPIGEATSRNLAKWKSLAGSSGPYTIVLTKRSPLSRDLERVRSDFRGRNVTTSRDLLFDNVVSAFTPSRDLEETPYFIEPDVASYTGRKVPALSYLAGHLLGRLDEPDQSIRADILVAPAGQGKTILAREIARRIMVDSKRKAIPILVESAQWQNLLNLKLPNVLNAALLHLIPQAVQLTNPKLFQLLVREQLLVMIFDGFDELCLHPQSSYSPTDLLSELIDLVGDTGARVLITTRETFWESYGLKEDGARVNRVNLQGFSNDQRQRFFTKRLKSLEERDIANRLTREIGERLYEGVVTRRPEQAERASGLPLLLELVAIYVDGNQSATFVPQSKDPLGPLLEAVCQRENVRQQLNISAAKQMLIFEEVFRDYSDDISKADLMTYVQYLAPETTPDALLRFQSHAFLSPGADVKPRFESLRVYFVARWLSDHLQLTSSDGPFQHTIIALLEKNSTGNTDIFDFLVERFDRMPKAQVKAAVTHAREMIQTRRQWEGAMSALFHLGQRLAHEWETTKQGRTAQILSLMGFERGFERTGVQGRVSGLDLRTITFRDCSLKDVEFHNCTFDDSTKLVGCRFDGSLNFENCSGAGRVDLINCKFSEAALLEWELQAGRASKHIINEEIARDALREILRKFLGPFGFASIKEADKNSGVVSRNPCKNEAWLGLMKEKIIEKHTISGVSEGGLHVIDSADVRHEVRNFIDNAALGPKLSRVVEYILKTDT